VFTPSSHTGTVQLQLHSFWTPALEVGDWSVTRPGHFAPEYRVSSKLVVPRAGLRFLENRKISCPFLCSYGTVWSVHPDVVSDKGERCLSYFLYWRSSRSTSALVIDAFVVSVVYVDGVVRGDFPLCSTTHFSFTMIFIQLPNYC
jgi:hypothetical protein